MNRESDERTMIELRLLQIKEECACWQYRLLEGELLARVGIATAPIDAPSSLPQTLLSVCQVASPLAKIVHG
jgi:hypothetical protein